MLFHLLAWLTVLLLFALWSGLCAVAHAVLTWEGWRGSIDWQLALPKFELPDWLAQWLGLDWVEGLRAWLVEHVHQHGRSLTPAELTEADKTAGEFVSVTLGYTEAIWATEFRDQLGLRYNPVTLVLTTGMCLERDAKSMARRFSFMV